MLLSEAALWVLPKAFELVGKSKIYCNPNDVVVLHRLFYLDILVAKNLNLLPVVPKAGVKTVEENG